MSNRVIEEQCTIIQAHGPRIRVEQLKVSFDTFSTVLSDVDRPGTKRSIIDQVISALASVPYRSKTLADVELVEHDFFTIVRDHAIYDPLQRRRAVDDPSQQLLLDASTLFVHLCSNIDDTNAPALKSLFFHEPLIDELGHCVEELATNDRCPNQPALLRSVAFLLTIFKHLHGHELDNSGHALLAPIFSAVVHCLCSAHAIELVRNLQRNFAQKLNDDQTLFLNTMPWYLQWYSDHAETKHYQRILRRLLPEFTCWLMKCQPDAYLQCTSKFGTTLRHLSYFLVRPIDSDHVTQLSDEFLHHYCQLVSYWSSVLSSTLAHSSGQLDGKFSARLIVQNLYNFTLHRHVLTFMKTIPNLIAMLLRMADVHNDELQLHTYRCLGKLMCEADIKAMSNAEQIVFVHVEFLANTIDDDSKSERFYSLLDSLKSE